MKRISKWKLTASLVATVVSAACSKEFSFEQLPQGQSGQSVTLPDDGDFGSGASFITETFSQGSGEAKLDILFVIDNSLSMAEEQARLGARLASFTNRISGIDWRIGVTTTDANSSSAHNLAGELIRFPNGSRVLSRTTPDFADEFLRTVVRPETGTGTEEPLKAMLLNMQKHALITRDLYRSDADLAIVVLSDEDEGGDGSGATKPAAVMSAFTALFGDRKRLSVYGVIVEPGDTRCFDDQNAVSDASYGFAVAQLASLTSGTTTSLCAADYGAGLAKIADRVGVLVTSVQLKNPVDPASVRVIMTPAQSIPFTVESNRIVFSRAPLPNTQIEIKYKKPL
jgi:hypothetical protein